MHFTSPLDYDLAKMFDLANTANLKCFYHLQKKLFLAKLYFSTHLHRACKPFNKNQGSNRDFAPLSIRPKGYPTFFSSWANFLLNAIVSSSYYKDQNIHFNTLYTKIKLPVCMVHTRVHHKLTDYIR